MHNRLGVFVEREEEGKWRTGRDGGREKQVEDGVDRHTDVEGKISKLTYRTDRQVERTYPQADIYKQAGQTDRPTDIRMRAIRQVQTQR